MFGRISPAKCNSQNKQTAAKVQKHVLYMNIMTNLDLLLPLENLEMAAWQSHQLKDHEIAPAVSLGNAECVRVLQRPLVSVYFFNPWTNCGMMRIDSCWENPTL